MRFAGHATILEHKKNHEAAKIEKQQRDEDKFKSDFDIKYKSKIVRDDEIVIRRFPLVFWLLGIIIVTLGIYLLYSIIVGPNNKAKLFYGLDNG